ncbi:UNVERIFIED_CONTAM: transmembrane protein [Trichonephila clavipes]
MQYIFPFLINQSGSALYTLALGSADLSLAVPLTNSLTFIFVSISGRLLGEKEEKSASYLGMTFVAAGVTLCVLESALK